MMMRQAELASAVQAYDPGASSELIEKAYMYSMKAHASQQRASGEPYFLHPLEVAFIVASFRLDVASVVTALLHDTVEDTSATLKDIEKEFGKEIAVLVDGVTKLSRLESKAETENVKQAENFRKLLIAMSEDLRVLLVKLADRLHNMRTLHFIKAPEKRKRIAQETLEIYASLAERIGMHHIKEELQDLAFAEMYPEARESIVNRLSFLREQGKAEVEKTTRHIKETLAEAGIPNAEVVGREKRPFSIWKKMENKNVSFEQMADIIAFRIITDTVGDCYQALGAIHSHYHTIPGHFKDYISTPKSNGYQSIHTSVIGPSQQRIEIQIRTREMHEVSEWGVAAHWSYKQGHDYGKEGKQFRWLRELLEILDKSAGPEDFLEHTKLEMYRDQVFCFTPRGDILALPRGATPVDFAYAVHSAIGDKCVGAKVNGKIVPLKMQLKNGDQVEIITAKTQTPSPAWERFVVTGKARSEIRKYMRTQQRSEYITLGKAILAKMFKQEDIDLTDKMLEPILEAVNKKTVDDVYAEIGEGTLSRHQILELVAHPDHKKAASATSLLGTALTKLRRKKNGGGHALPIKGLIPGMAIHFAGCCHPIPGDRIVGIVTTGKGITIHTIDCETLENFSDTPERWIEVAWDTGGEQLHVGRLRAHIAHEPAALATVTSSIAKDLGNINNFKITNRSPDFFEIMVDIEVRDVAHLNTIIATLRSKDVVQSVERYHA